MSMCLRNGIIASAGAGSESGTFAKAIAVTENDYTIPIPDVTKAYFVVGVSDVSTGPFIPDSEAIGYLDNEVWHGTWSAQTDNMIHYQDGEIIANAKTGYLSVIEKTDSVNSGSAKFSCYEDSVINQAKITLPNKNGRYLMGFTCPDGYGSSGYYGIVYFDDGTLYVGSDMYGLEVVGNCFAYNGSTGKLIFSPPEQNIAYHLSVVEI